MAKLINHVNNEPQNDNDVNIGSETKRFKEGHFVNGYFYGSLITKDDMYVNGSEGLYFNDTATQIWEDDYSSLTFKDDIAGTYTLRQLAMRKAYCLENAPSGHIIQCSLDTHGGTQVGVYCTIVGNNPSVDEDLSSSYPLLEAEDPIYVYYDGAKWVCVTLFQRIEDYTTGGGMPALKYISGYALNTLELESASDGSNWGINNAIIKAIKIQTDSTNWSLTLYCDSDQSSGMFDSLDVAKSASGDQVLLLDLPYTDNDVSSSVHCMFVDDDNPSQGDTALMDIYGVEATV